jgi:flagellar motor switch protein FliG
MKSIDEMSGAEKAAALFVAMGADVSADVCKFLDEDEIMKMSKEMMKIEKLDVEEKDDLIGEFIIQLKKINKNALGGEEVAKKLLIDAFGMEKAKKIYNKVKEIHIDDTFEFLNDVEPAVIASLVEKEHAQTISVMLTYLDSSKAGQVLKELPRELAKDVAVRIAKMQRIAPEAVLEISRILRRKYDEMLSGILSQNEVAGVDKIAEIMNHMSGDSENRIMNHFETVLPNHAQEIRERIYSFDNITLLSNKEVRILIDEVADDRVIVLALKGAGDDIRFKIIRNMSNNRATDILEDMNHLGVVRMSDVQEARREIVSIMRELNDNGIIILRKGNEQYIE